MLQLILPFSHVENLHHIASIACLVHSLVQFAFLVKCSQISWEVDMKPQDPISQKTWAIFSSSFSLLIPLEEQFQQFRILSLSFLLARQCLRAFFRCFHSLPPWGVQVLMNITWRWETVASRRDGLTSANQELHNQAKPLHRLSFPVCHSSTHY